MLFFNLDNIYTSHNMTVRADYPYCGDIIDSNYSALYSTEAKDLLYVRTKNDRFVFENPIFSNTPKSKTEDKHGIMGIKDFLASIPSFSDFTDQQLTTLEQKATTSQFAAGEIIFKQGEPGDVFYVISQGAVDVLIQDNPVLLRKGDLGKTVNRLVDGCYFGERALMTAEQRAASIRVANKDVTCFLFSRAVYEEIISGSNALIGQDTNVDVDWSKDHETRSLFKHIENILDIDKIDASPKIKRILYELSTAFTPELSADEVISRMVMTVKIALKVDRVGLFVLSEDKRSMVLKVSERSKGVRLPVRGLAGAVCTSNKAINIADAYQDSRFDATMDRRTGYRTRQILGVPLRHPLSGDAIGLLQVNNRLDGATEGFNAEQQRVLELAAEQLSELLHGRADVFIHSGGVGVQKSYGQGVGDGMVLLNSAEISTPFSLELFTLSLGQRMSEVIAKEGLTAVEITVSLHLALNMLCEPRKVHQDIPARNGSTQQGGGNRDSTRVNSQGGLQIQLRERLEFDIAVKDLPRATRILFRVAGHKKKKGSSAASAANSSARVSLGWVACTIFDFKGCVDCVLDHLCLFDTASEIEVPINTTLSNENDPLATTLSAVLSPDLVLATDSKTPRVRIVHSMPNRVEPIEGDKSIGGLSDAHARELDRILKLSFNPLSMTLLTDTDKEFLWELRYHILNRADLLPAFVMGILWNDSERVQELYDLLDLWEPPSAVQALQLLDRRFMDPKVRAYAAHCLEDLPDEELALYMLQLCQQLKFENHVDSALSRFLLRRALTNQKLIGHIYFWLLHSETSNRDVSKRFIILLQVYIRNCGAHRIELGHQMFVMKRLEHVAEQVKLGESKEARKKILADRLNEIVLPAVFKLPLNPHLKVCGIDVSRCRVMESKKKPLWLTLKDANGGKDIVLMLKVGDDLRQDALIMQLLRVMNDLWRREGLDMQMRLYDCISTGFERGLLQVVLNANTLGEWDVMCDECYHVMVCVCVVCVIGFDFQSLNLPFV